jgi:hypothetical protein
MKKVFRILFLIVFLSTLAVLTSRERYVVQGALQDNGAVFLPLMLRTHIPDRNPVMLGMYPQSWPGLQSTIDNEIHAAEGWSGKEMSIVGTFTDFEEPNYTANIQNQLTTIWNNGYTPFVNIGTSHTSYAVATGEIDNAIRAWARAYAAYATGGGGRMAFIAPLDEMNGNWVPYYDGGNKENFKLAYAHIRQIFAEEGVPAESVRWVFAPNGFTIPGDEFEYYYPGDTTVDVVAFSAYNFGYHPYNSAWPDWKNPDEVFGPYLDRMRALAPTKPIFIAQTGTTSYAANGPNPEMKNSWLHSAYSFLAAYQGVRAVIYFNIVNEQQVDWPFYVPEDTGHQYPGYIEGVSSPEYIYLTPEALKSLPLLP